jgi:hypothetical protein
LFKITPLKGAFVVNSKGAHEANFEMGQDRRITLSFSPVCGIEVPKDANAIFSTLGLTVFIMLNSSKCKGRKSAANDREKALVFILCNIFPCFGV